MLRVTTRLGLMNGDSILLIVIALLLAAAAPPVMYAHRRGQLFAADLALPLLPAVLLVSGILLLNQRAQTGWGLVLYPVFCAVASVVVLWIRVFVVAKLLTRSRVAAVAVLVVVCAAAFVFGAAAPAWYE